LYIAPSNYRLQTKPIMRRKQFTPLLCILGAGMFALLSCHNENNPTSNVLANADSLAKVKTAAAATADQDSEVYLLPSPLLIATIFKNAGLNYYPNLAAPIKDVGQFTTAYDRSINMGIYSADLSYCVLNKQTQDATNYLNVVQGLAGKMGFGAVFGQSMLNRFKSNIDNTDSLAQVIGDLQMGTDSYLEANKEKYIGVLAFTGAWIESMYVGSKVYEKGKSNNVSSRISEQINILDNLLKLLNKYQAQDSHIPALAKDLQGIQDTYAAYSEVKNYNPDSDKSIALTPDHVAQISSMIQDLRAKFIAS
jgi:hypothetical protein